MRMILFGLSVSLTWLGVLTALAAIIVEGLIRRGPPGPIAFLSLGCIFAAAVLAMIALRVQP